MTFLNIFFVCRIVDKTLEIHKIPVSISKVIKLIESIINN